MTRLVLAAFAGAALLPTSALAQNYTMTTGTQMWQDITIIPGATQLTFTSSDDGEAQVMLSGPLDFFGTQIPVGTSVGVQTNGTVNLSGASTAYQNTALPASATPNGIVAPFWDDLELGSGAVHYVDAGPLFVVQWANVQLLNTTNTISFQAAFDRSTGSIVLVFGPRTGTGGTASIGIEDPAGTVGDAMACTPSCTFTDVPEGTFVQFTPGGMPPMGVDLSVVATMPLPPTVPENSMLQLPFTVSNNGNATSGATEITLYGNDREPAAGTNEIATLQVPAIPAGGTHQDVFPLMSGMADGSTFYMAFRIDPSNSVAETNENNNDAELGGTTIVGNMPMDITITTPATLPIASVGVTYSATIQATGSPNPQFSLDGGSLPPGLTLDANGIISGIPTGAVVSSFTVVATETGYNPGRQTFTLEVTDMPQPLSIVAATPPGGQVNVPYTFTFQAQGGMPPYTWSGANLPPGLTLLPVGTLEGTPTTEGSYSFDVVVGDGAAGAAMTSVTVSIAPAGMPGNVTITTPDRIEFRKNAMVDYQLSVTGGTAPYTWFHTGGMMPPGLALVGDRIQGTATSTATEVVTISVGESGGASVSKTITVVVSINGPTTSTGGGRAGGRSRGGGCGCHSTFEDRPAGATVWIIVSLAAFGLLARTRRRRYARARRWVSKKRF